MKAIINFMQFTKLIITNFITRLINFAITTDNINGNMHCIIIHIAKATNNIGNYNYTKADFITSYTLNKRKIIFINMIHYF